VGENEGDHFGNLLRPDCRPPCLHACAGNPLVHGVVDVDRLTPVNPFVVHQIETNAPFEIRAVAGVTDRLIRFPSGGDKLVVLAHLPEVVVVEHGESGLQVGRFNGRHARL